MSYSKEYISKFYSLLTLTFTNELKKSGLKCPNKSFQDNFYTFMGDCLRRSLDHTFKNLTPPGK